MARYIATAPGNGFTVEQVTQGQLYPAAEVAQYLDETSTDAGPDISEGQAFREVDEAVDTSGVVRLGEGPTVVYAYGYHCAPDRLKVGLTEGDTVQRIAAQIGTGTPDKPDAPHRDTHARLQLVGAGHPCYSYVSRHESRRW